MRFRFMQMSDLPEACRLYEQMLAEREPDEILYPNTGERTSEEFTIVTAAQLLNNPNWFAICGVVGSRIHEDEQGAKHVIGGKTKAFITVSLSQRTIGTPKNISFTELVLVDTEFRQHDIARKLVQLMAVESAQRGAHVLEAAWTPRSLGSKIWERLGCIPYRVLGAWITPDGAVRTDLPMVKTPTEAPASSAPKKRGRPPKVQPTTEV